MHRFGSAGGGRPSDARPSFRPIAAPSFKRSLFGYRPSEVDAALATRDSALAEATAELARHAATLADLRARMEAEGARAAQLEVVCDQLSDRVVARERELAELRSELGAVREQSGRGLEALAAIAGELEGVRRQARGQATRIRLRALREAADLAARMDGLANDPRGRERLLVSIGEAIERIAADEDIELDLEPASPAVANGRSPHSAAELFDGMVEIEVGPLEDFSQLVGFEDAAGGIMATSEISVKRFAQGRATLEMKLAEPVELLRELEQRSPFEFRVRDRRFDRLVLDVDEIEAA